MTKHTLLTREESFRASELIRDRLGSDRPLKVISTVLTKARGEGEFSGYASTFDVEPDLQGDVVAHHAFRQSIKDWRSRNAWPPLLWNHENDSPASVLGVVTEMTENQRGLLVTGKLDLTHEPAVAVWKAMKSGRITAFSFAFAVTREHKRDDGINVLDELEVLDVTITPTPANLNARLVSIKSEPKRTLNREALKDFVAAGKAMLGAKARQFESDEMDEAIVESLAQAHLVFDHGMPADEVLGMSVDEMRAAHPSEHQRGADHDHDYNGMTTDKTADPRPNDPRRYAKLLDDLEHTKAGPVPDPDAVDRFVTETKQELAEKSLDRAEQAAWESRMQLNAVLDPVPVRVDARMRPVTS
jgi:uncharacterized protein